MRNTNCNVNLYHDCTTCIPLPSPPTSLIPQPSLALVCTPSRAPPPQIYLNYCTPLCSTMQLGWCNLASFPDCMNYSSGFLMAANQVKTEELFPLCLQLEVELPLNLKMVIQQELPTVSIMVIPLQCHRVNYKTSVVTITTLFWQCMIFKGHDSSQYIYLT